MNRLYMSEELEQEAKRLFIEFMATLPNNGDYVLTVADEIARVKYMHEHASQALKAYWEEIETKEK